MLHGFKTGNTSGASLVAAETEAAAQTVGTPAFTEGDGARTEAPAYDGYTDTDEDTLVSKITDRMRRWFDEL